MNFLAFPRFTLVMAPRHACLYIARVTVKGPRVLPPEPFRCAINFLFLLCDYTLFQDKHARNITCVHTHTRTCIHKQSTYRYVVPAPVIRQLVVVFANKVVNVKSWAAVARIQLSDHRLWPLLTWCTHIPVNIELMHTRVCCTRLAMNARTHMSTPGT